jgi:hypothetical protein
VVAVLAVVAALGGLVVPTVYAALAGTTAKDRIAADPPPALFPVATTRRIDALTGPQPARAHRLMAGWWHAHGRRADDTAFTAWLEETFPGPPSAADRSREITEVERLDRQRTSAGITAATGLEGHGKKDVWKLEVHDQAEYLDSRAGDRRKAQLDALLKLSKDVADTLGTRFGQSAPYVLEPALRTDHTVTPGQTCPCSYPSRHATAAAAARTFLAHFDPQRDGDYRWFQDEIDYSRLYMAGHVASDLSGGSLLGDMIGEYVVVTRTGTRPAAVWGRSLSLG